MLKRFLIRLLIGLILAGSVKAASLQDGGYGPEVSAFLELLKDEEEELEFQLNRNEIQHRNYLRAKARIAILRQTIIERVKKTGEDVVPELNVVTASEVNQLIEIEPDALRRMKVGSIIEEKWRYLGRASRGEIFYIFERIKKR